jgi:hypothetical protein
MKMSDEKCFSRHVVNAKRRWRMLLNSAGPEKRWWEMFHWLHVQDKRWWKRFGNCIIRRRGNIKGFSNHVLRKRSVEQVFSEHVDRRIEGRELQQVKFFLWAFCYSSQDISRAVRPDLSMKATLRRHVACERHCWLHLHIAEEIMFTRSFAYVARCTLAR